MLADGCSMRRPMSPARSIVISSAAAALLAATALAGEGSLPVRAGDTVSGTLVRCGDRQVFETEVAAGEKFRVDVVLADVTAAPELRIETQDGTDVTSLARVRSGGGSIVAGPFRAPESGVYRVSLTSSAAHEVVYAATPRVARRRAQSVHIPPGGRTASVVAAAGSTLTLGVRRGTTPTIVAGFPGEPLHQLAPGDPLLAALAGGGLSAPCAGTYTFAIAAGSGARLRVAPPAAVAPKMILFPPLPDAGTVNAWYPSIGWVAAPATEPAPVPSPAAPPEVPLFWSTALAGMLGTSAPVPSLAEAADVTKWLGPADGVGMPLAGEPMLEEIFGSGVATDTASGRSYDVTVPRPGLGDVTYHVAFSVDGRLVAAPLSLSGRVSISWTVTSGAPSHSGHWTLTLDPVRNVEVLDGSESLTDAAARTTSAAARGFAVRSGTPSWPSGALTWGRDDPRNATSVVRRETYDGTSTVHVETGASLATSQSGDVSLGR
jgi:hypothetical protein